MEKSEMTETMEMGKVAIQLAQEASEAGHAQVGPLLLLTHALVFEAMASGS